MVVQPVRSLSHPDIAYFVFDSATRSAGLVDPADDRLIRNLLKVYDARMEWVASTRDDDDMTRSMNRIAAATGAATVSSPSFQLGRFAFEALPFRNLPYRFIRGPLALFTGRVLEAGEIMESSDALRRQVMDEVLAVLDSLPDLTRLYPAKGPQSTVWLERTYNSDLW
jgi:hypothetical protein